MMVLSREPNAELRWGHYSEGIPSIEPLQSRFHAAASKRIGAVLKSSLMLSTAARRAASIAFHRTASGKATRRQLKYQRTSKGKAMNIEARRRMSDLMFPTGKMVFFIKRVHFDPCQGTQPVCWCRPLEFVSDGSVC